MINAHSTHILKKMNVEGVKSVVEYVEESLSFKRMVDRIDYVKNTKFDYSQRDEKGRSILWHMIRNEQDILISYLLSFDVNCELECIDEHGRTCLMTLLCSGYYDFIPFVSIMLTKYKYDIYHKDTDGNHLVSFFMSNDNTTNYIPILEEMIEKNIHDSKFIELLLSKNNEGHDFEEIFIANDIGDYIHYPKELIPYISFNQNNFNEAIKSKNQEFIEIYLQKMENDPSVLKVDFLDENNKLLIENMIEHCSDIDCIRFLKTNKWDITQKKKGYTKNINIIGQCFYHKKHVVLDYFIDSVMKNDSYMEELFENKVSLQMFQFFYRLPYLMKLMNGSEKCKSHVIENFEPRFFYQVLMNQVNPGDYGCQEFRRDYVYYDDDEEYENEEDPLPNEDIFIEFMNMIRTSKEKDFSLSCKVRNIHCAEHLDFDEIKEFVAFFMEYEYINAFKTFMKFHMRIDNYYDLLDFVKDDEVFLHYLVKENRSFKNHIKKTLKKESQINQQAVRLDEDCPICYSSLENTYQKCETCKCSVHNLCLGEWFKKKNTCVMCRTPFSHRKQKTILSIQKIQQYQVWASTYLS